MEIRKEVLVVHFMISQDAQRRAQGDAPRFNQ